MPDGGPPRPLEGDAAADVAVVGAGIAGVATAFFTLRETDKSVLLVERRRVAWGASGRNAGQLTTYFERPLSAIADEFGAQAAVAAQREFDSAHDLLDLMVQESGAQVRVERFTGHMGMFNLHQVEVHLRNNLIRRQGGWRVEACAIAEDADFRGDIPGEFDGLYDIVPRARVRELLEIDDDRYSAVLSDLKGCANSGLLAQQVLDHLLIRYSERFRYFDHTPVATITVAGDEVRLGAGAHEITAGQVVLCTNGFIDHVVRDTGGAPIPLAANQRIAGCAGHMTAFVEDQPREPAAMSYIRNTRIGSAATAYVYVTRRTYDRTAGTVTLTCMGGPEVALDAIETSTYDPDVPFPGDLLTEMDEVVRPFANPQRPPGKPYDFHWHGLMGYNESGVRVVGAHPRHPALLYNLGCNGVGFLPSIFGGRRVARLIRGEQLAPSIFDPR